jgi:ABC-type polysaccharide/polyol phosphate transport system ATPase subunit
MQQFRDQGATVLLVSHNMDTIAAMCHHAAWLDHGLLRRVGPVDEVIQAYRDNQ